VNTSNGSSSSSSPPKSSSPPSTSSSTCTPAWTKSRIVYLIPANEGSGVAWGFSPRECLEQEELGQIAGCSCSCPCVGVDVGASGRGCCLIIYNTKEKPAGALCTERKGEEREKVLYMCTARICGQNDKCLPTYLAKGRWERWSFFFIFWLVGPLLPLR
jgi:hypothetical protein